MLESAYPYTSGATGDDFTDCLYSASKETNVKVMDYKRVINLNTTSIKLAVH